MPGSDTLVVIMTALSFQNFREWQVYDHPDAVRWDLAMVVGFPPRPLTAVSAAAPLFVNFGGNPRGGYFSIAPCGFASVGAYSPRTREPPNPDRFLSGCSYDSAQVPELELWPLLDFATQLHLQLCVADILQ